MGRFKCSHLTGNYRPIKSWQAGYFKCSHLIGTQKISSSTESLWEDSRLSLFTLDSPSLIALLLQGYYSQYLPSGKHLTSKRASGLRPAISKIVYPQVVRIINSVAPYDFAVSYHIVEAYLFYNALYNCFIIMHNRPLSVTWQLLCADPLSCNF